MPRALDTEIGLRTRTGPDRLFAAGAVLLLVVGPLWFPGAGALHHAITPKTLVIGVLVALCVLLALTRPLRGLELGVGPDSLDLGVGLFALAAALSAFGAASLFRAGAGLLFLGVFTAWYLAASRSLDMKTAARFLLPAMAVTGALAGLHALMQLQGFDPLEPWLVKPYRICSVFGNPNYLAGFLALTFPAALAGLHFHGRFRVKLFFAVLCFIQMTAAAATRSRAGLMALAAGFAVMALLRFLDRDRSHRAESALSWGALAAALAVWFILLNPAGRVINPVPDQVRVHDQMIRDFKPDSNEQRLLIWRSALMLGLENPLTGVGVNNFGRHYARAALETARRTPGFDKPELTAGIAEVAHSEHLQVWAEMGAVGLAAWLFLMAAAGLKCLKVIRTGGGREALGLPVRGAPAAGLAALLALATVDFPLHIAPSALLGWTYLALIRTAAEPQPGRSIRPGSLPGYLAPALGLAVMAAAALWAMPLVRAHAIHHRGRAAYAEADFRRAATLMNRAVELNPEAAEHHYWRSRAYTRMNLDALALWDLERAEELGMTTPGIYKEIGLIWGRNQVWHKAAAGYNAGLDMIIEPGQAHHVDLLVNMGNLMRRAESWEKSIPWYSTAVEVAPDDAQAWMLLGSARLKTMNFEAGLEALLRALELAPHSAEVMELVGQAHHHLGEYGEAIDWYLRAIDANPGFARAHLNLGIIQHQLGRHYEAMESLERAVFADPASEAAFKARTLLAPMLDAAEAGP